VNRANYCLAIALIALSAMSAQIARGAGDTDPPAAAKAMGFLVNSFHSNFRGDVDLENQKNRGANWFLERWFGAKPTRPERLKIDSVQGITLTDGGDQGNYTIGSAAMDKSRSPSKWVGSAFGGGGYFEAVIKFDTASVRVRDKVGFPAWWLEPIEHMADPKTDYWIGQEPGYEHFVEVDIFEYNQWAKHAPNFYSGAVHEWYGVYSKTCPPNYCRVSNMNGLTQFDNFVIEVPSDTDFGSFHKFAVLWVPATASSKGYIQYYFDDMKMADRVSWSKLSGEQPPPGKSPWTFGVLDKQHMVLILGTGNEQPMTVRSVNVWQKSVSENLHLQN
jgi:hypothetical protein